ncbi:MAG: hypothetical protein JGK06_01425 [Microcoleus sp. PH2017_36_ELK_O_B]|nr:hypothetical protein [Microcoleus sp. PH2017_36_ELK_O_B]
MVQCAYISIALIDFYKLFQPENMLVPIHPALTQLTQNRRCRSESDRTTVRIPEF